nr:electron transfer flavoprotein subunit alpha [Candidatus Aenigmarchaeota archaeon]
MIIRVDKILCTSCGICKTHCSFGALTFDNSAPVFNDLCVFCGACVNVCPVEAITIRRREIEKDISDYSGVMAFIERERGAIKPVALEIMGAARQLADRLKETCSAVVLGAGQNADQILLSR